MDVAARTETAPMLSPEVQAEVSGPRLFVLATASAEGVPATTLVSWICAVGPSHLAIALADAAGVLCTDELLLHPDPYKSREDWCRDRLATMLARLDELPSLPTVF